MLALVIVAGVATKTIIDLQPIHSRSLRLDPAAQRPRVLDRRGNALTQSYAGEWNIAEQVSLRDIPDQLKTFFLFSEDRRFYEHGGVDWYARFAALLQGLSAGRVVRGASTVTEQVVRMIHPRPRTFWSRWLEGFEAAALEKHYSKNDILEFYLNQVPYARRRRGVQQAARLYFDRDLTTLSVKESLALATLVRAPGRWDMLRNPRAIEPVLLRLAQALRKHEVLSDDVLREAESATLELRSGQLEPGVEHYLLALRERAERKNVFDRDDTIRPELASLLDSEIQSSVQKILDSRIAQLHRKRVGDGAVLVVENRTGEILAWVNAGAFDQKQDGSQIDLVLAPRQPGSTLKPFLYALALEKGWTAATLILDDALVQNVGLGLHRFKNYSRIHYGPLRLREALGNSLNVPAVRTAEFVGPAALLQRLHQLSFLNLRESAEFYGEGLALGSGEVSLYELTQAYAALARRGRFAGLRMLRDEPLHQRQVYSPEIASLVSDILSDPAARRREFGSGEMLRFPVRTAVKTGTSTDYRDAWALGYSDRYTVGVWMGNLNREPMAEVTGSSGPSLVLRSIFALLERRGDSRDLYLSPRLQRSAVCGVSGVLPGDNCPKADEWFLPRTVPAATCDGNHSRHGILSEGSLPHTALVQIDFPTPGLQLARDPRIPDQLEAFEFKGRSVISPIRRTQWIVNNEVVSNNSTLSDYAWPIRQGPQSVELLVEGANGQIYRSQKVSFRVR